MPEVTHPVTKAMLLEKLKDVSELKGWLLVDREAEHDASAQHANDNNLQTQNPDILNEIIDEENELDELHFVLPKPYNEKQLARFEETLIALEVEGDLSTSDPVTLEIDSKSLINLHHDIHTDYVGYLTKLASVSGIDGLRLLSLKNPNEEEEPSLCIEIPLIWPDQQLIELVNLLQKSGVVFALEEEHKGHILTIKPDAIDHLSKSGIVHNHRDDLLAAVNSFTPVLWGENYWPEAQRYGFSPRDHITTTQRAQLDGLFSNLGIKLNEINDGRDNVLWLEFGDAQRVYNEVQRKSRAIEYVGRVEEKSTRIITD